MALALLAPPKGKAAPTQNQSTSTPETSTNNNAALTSAPEPTGRWDFSRLFTVETAPEIVQDAMESADQLKELAANTWELTVTAAAETEADSQEFNPKPMKYEEIRLWLQSFNAGPYALLKYQGEVPFKETRDYVPRVMKYYEQDLSSDYDELIDKAAAKYGLEPQLIKAVMKTESNFRNDCVSHAGARGLMQVMPVVWKDIKGKYDLDWDYNTQVFEPEKNIEVACAYLAWLRYDFLPRHFAAFDRNPDAPTILVRDHDRGVPDRETPRLVAKSDTTTPRPTEPSALASATMDVRSVVSDAETVAKSSEEKVVSAKAQAPDASGEKAKAEPVKADAPAKADKTQSADSKVSSTKGKEPAAASTGKSGIVITDSSRASTTKTADGKIKVTTRGSGKAISISVGKGGKVVTKSKSADKEAVSRAKTSVAKARADKEDTETQGG